MLEYQLIEKGEISQKVPKAFGIGFECFRSGPIVTVFVILSLLGCSSLDDKEYLVSIQHWHQLRIDSLKGETGFLNLAGLYWLEEGENTFGTDTSNQIEFPSIGTPLMGSFLLQDSMVFLIPSGPIKIKGEVVSDTVLIFNNDEAPVMVYNSLHWIVIKRGEHVGIRLRDFNHPLLQSFDSIDYYKTNPEWRVEAEMMHLKNPEIVSFNNVLGMTIEYPIYYKFQFTIDGKVYELEPLGKADGDGYFVMFYDKTSGHSTYGSGRYIYVAEPDEEGKTIIDFNKAYNPPCAFTEFATCLFPHKKNRVPIFIEAGEKFSGH